MAAVNCSDCPIPCRASQLHWPPPHPCSGGRSDANLEILEINWGLGELNAHLRRRDVNIWSALISLICYRMSSPNVIFSASYPEVSGFAYRLRDNTRKSISVVLVSLFRQMLVKCLNIVYNLFFHFFKFIVWYNIICEVEELMSNNILGLINTRISTKSTVGPCQNTQNILNLSPSSYTFMASRLFLILIILQTVGLLGGAISSSQSLYLNTGQHKHRINTYTYQTSNPIQSNDLIWNRTRDLQACSAVPQPTTLPCAPNEVS
jgi:hypothetical protein